MFSSAVAMASICRAFHGYYLWGRQVAHLDTEHQARTCLCVSGGTVGFQRGSTHYLLEDENGHICEAGEIIDYDCDLVDSVFSSPATRTFPDWLLATGMMLAAVWWGLNHRAAAHPDEVVRDLARGSPFLDTAFDEALHFLGRADRLRYGLSNCASALIVRVHALQHAAHEGVVRYEDLEEVVQRAQAVNRYGLRFIAQLIGLRPPRGHRRALADNQRVGDRGGLYAKLKARVLSCSSLMP